MQTVNFSKFKSLQSIVRLCAHLCRHAILHPDPVLPLLNDATGNPGSCVACLLGLLRVVLVPPQVILLGMEHKSFANDLEFWSG